VLHLRKTCQQAAKHPRLAPQAGREGAAESGCQPAGCVGQRQQRLGQPGATGAAELAIEPDLGAVELEVDYRIIL